MILEDGKDYLTFKELKEALLGEQDEVEDNDGARDYRPADSHRDCDNGSRNRDDSDGARDVIPNECTFCSIKGDYDYCGAVRIGPNETMGFMLFYDFEVDNFQLIVGKNKFYLDFKYCPECGRELSHA